MLKPMMTWVQLTIIFSWKQKNIVLNLFNVSAFFVFCYVCLYFICLQKSMCWQNVSHNTNESFRNTVAIYTCYSWGVPWYIAQHVHSLQHIKAHGDLGAPSLSYFLKTNMNLIQKWDMMEYLYIFFREAFSWILCLGKFVCVIYLWFSVYLAVSCLQNYGHD